ncbi:mediator of RNA polymerase II transcription subunit 21 [Physcomitrium patens]|uniref:Mediator of RNA polymerase II transcription subunit 21 n=1 Tax=Physcomitrium patens TaxID=3218 RepID=A9SBM1_PHYPA|nr:mediator of RNA polymerase II transcription subunit 21-like [Physcomitrium patens]PNR62322.1 hypothetical protein PHYPA_000746 [Physcomitrium patens]|eukprot:XP_024383931.1 mediator of RNA polymerase II transcription subunit 21-like [Physcomitrella patens]
MDIIAQLQEHASAIAYIAFNAAGTIQRDAPPSQLAQDYPKPTGITTEALEQPKEMATAFVQAVQRFDALVSALPDIQGGEEAQLKRIAELEAENEAFGQELQRELEAADSELNQIQELFDMATDNWLQMKPP